MIALNDLARHHAPLRAALDAAIARVQRSRPLHPRSRGRGVRARVRRVLRRRSVRRGGQRHRCAGARVARARHPRRRRRRDRGQRRHVRDHGDRRRRRNAGLRRRRRCDAAHRSRALSRGESPRARAPSSSPISTAVWPTSIALARIAHERGIALVEDCAQAHGAQSRRPKGGHLRRDRLLQLLPDEEPGRAGRRRRPRHRRSGAGLEADARCAPTAGAESTTSRSKAA